MNEWACEQWPDYEGGQPALAADEVHVWQLKRTSDFAQFLPAYETARYEKIAHDENRRGYAMSQGGLRRIASFYLGRDWREVEVQRREHGKPYIAEGPEFNLSHTVGKVFAVFSEQAVGLDIESADRKVNAEKLARRYFAETEAEHITQAPETERNALFLRYWVCKEATVKLSGDGIYHGLGDVRITLGEGGHSRGEYRGRPLELREFRLSDGLMGAVAAWQTFAVKGFFRV